MAKSCSLPKGAFPVKFKVKSVVHALELAKGLIRPFKHWTIGLLAATGVTDEFNGYKENEKSPRAEAFCALGALRRVNTKYGRKAEKFLQEAAGIILGNDTAPNPGDIFRVNDGVRDKKTHRTVLKMFTKAIRLAKKAEAK